MCHSAIGGPETKNTEKQSSKDRTNDNNIFSSINPLAQVVKRVLSINYRIS